MKMNRMPHPNDAFCATLRWGFLALVMREFRIMRCAAITFALALTACITACHKTDAEGRMFRRAAASGDVATIRVMLQKNPKVVFSDDKSGSTALEYAVSRHQTEVVELLLANNARVDARNYHGITPLFAASAKGYADIARLLITAKADVNGKNSHGFTPLDVAAFNGHIDVAELLLDTGAGVNIADGRGATPLYWARKNGQKTMEDFLRQHGGQDFAPSYGGSEWP